MASKFTLWLQEYKKLTSEVRNIPLVNIKEVLSVGGQHFILSLGKDSKVEQDDHEIDPKYLRQYFTSNKNEFYDVLEILRTRVTEQRAFAINVCNALTEQAVPEVVMARLQGEQVSGDAFEMLKLGTRKKLDALMKLAQEIKTPFKSFDISIEVAGKNLNLAMAVRGFDSIEWGDIKVSAVQASTVTRHDEGTLEDDMFFLTNFEFIKQALTDLGGRLAKV